MTPLNNHNNRFQLGAKGLINSISFPVILILLFVAALGVGFLAANNMSLFIFGFIAGLFAILIIHRCIIEPIQGYYLVLFIAFFAELPGRIINKPLPVATFLEILVLALFIGTSWNAKKDDNQKGNLLKYSVSILFIIYTLYYILQLFNPNMGSPVGWLFSSKRFLAQILFFVISYRLINTPERFRYMLKFWIVMSLITALYGCYQQWFGLLPMDLNSIDEHERNLLFQGGVIRKFSFLEGVVTFGSLCGCMSVLTIIIAISEKKRKRKYRYFFASFILFLGMLYSGTRTFNIMMPAGIALYILMTLRNKATILTLFISFITILFVLYAPIDNPVLNRLRSSFNTKEESLTIRTINRKSVQPYIYSHPFGGGVASSGVEGMRFNPAHPLAGFPPDSGLLKLALDVGWIGLSIAMMFFLMVLYQGIYYYFRIKNEEYKKYVIAIICSLFAMFITLYSQVTIGQMPTVFFIFGMMSGIKRLMEFDEKENVEQG